MYSIDFIVRSLTDALKGFVGRRVQQRASRRRGRCLI